MRKKVRPEQHLEFFLSMVESDIQHLNNQEKAVNEWIRMSILSLTKTETSYLKKMRNEYKQKASEQTLILKELQKTLSIYQIMQKEA
ncbi:MULTISPECIES: hypothetical protein [Bacillaceae]|uniref:hypothetical protein n=1 Tax=Bacillaceae TaxID=186817 RepID=UPI00088A2A2F|nr:hypothetical protein [Bacillus sp. OK048]SDM86330.1 hypothetical protein SAMN05443253_10689 [Bacillus sp. OK048]